MTAPDFAALLAEIREVADLTVGPLRARFEAVVGRPARSFNVVYLRGAIVKGLRVRAESLDLSDRDRGRLERAIREANAKPRLRALAPPFEHDPRVPPIGTVLRRRHGVRDVVVRVTRTGFTWEGRPYRSLSAIAREATGQRWNGLLWFGLRPRQRGFRGPGGAS